MCHWQKAGVIHHGFFQGTVVSFDGGRGGVGKGTEVVAGATGSCY